MTIRAMTTEDWPQVWPFFDKIVRAGETYAYTTDLTLGGMVKHLAFVEDWWFGRHLMDSQSEPWSSVDWSDDGDWDWHSAADDTPEELWALWEAAVARSQSAVSRDPRPARESARPRRDGTPFTLRWVLAHMVAEYARHLGHADLIRQSVDGQVGDTWLSAR